MQDVEDEPLFAERVAGIDIAKAGIEVAVRVPSDTTAGRRQQETRSFRTTRKELLALADWLRSWGVTKVGMESTGDYWKPVYFLLEQQDLDCVLYHAAQVKALPGRPKTDKQDAVRIAKITERGSLPSSFVPPEDIRRLRTRTRYRRTVTQARTAEMQRAGKLLEDAHLKLSSVISDIHGVSGRAMLEAIIAGERNPVRLAQLARGRMRGKIRQLEEALDCSFLTGEHVFILTMMLAAIDGHTARISELTARIEQLTEPYWHQIDQLDAVHGTGIITAQDVIAEIGAGMTVFPTAAHLVSWAKWCPQVARSGGKRKGSNATGRGNRYLSGALGEASMGARPHRLVPRREIPAAEQAHAQTQSPRRDRQLHPDHLPRPATGPRRQLSRPRPRLLRPARRYPPPGPQPPQEPGTPRLQSHPRTPDPRHRPGPARHRLTSPTEIADAAPRRRPLPPAHQRLYFRTRTLTEPVAAPVTGLLFPDTADTVPRRIHPAYGRRPEPSRSPWRTPVMNARHSSGVYRWTGPRPRFLVSRTRIMPSRAWPTSTQLAPPLPLKLAFRQRRSSTRSICPQLPSVSGPAKHLAAVASPRTRSNATAALRTTSGSLIV